jgi:hypothetical protein
MENEALKVHLKKLHEKNRQLKFTLAIALVIVAYVFINSFESQHVTLGTPGDGVTQEEVYAVRSKWWGLSKTRTRIKWKTPSSDRNTRNSDFHDWCYEASPGLWIPYYSDN